MSIKNIKIGGKHYSPEELGLERITVNGHTYLDVTPFWIDSKQSQRIQQIIASDKKVEEDFDGEGVEET